MPLASKLAFYFEKRVQFKGIGLFQSRRVDVSSYSPGHLDAIVHGGSDYAVRLRFADKRLRISCAMPVLRRERRVQAPLGGDSGGRSDRRADPRRRGTGPAGRGRLRRASPGWCGRPSQCRSAPPQSQIPAWEEHLTAIRHGLEQKKAGDDVAARLSGAVRDRSRQLEERPDTSWWSCFRRRARRMASGAQSRSFASTPPPSRFCRTRPTWRRSHCCLGGQTSSLYSYESSYGSTSKALPPPLALKLLPMLDATGRLYSRPASYSTDLSPLHWDARRAMALHSRSAAGRSRPVEHHRHVCAGAKSGWIWMRRRCCWRTAFWWRTTAWRASMRAAALRGWINCAASSAFRFPIASATK